MESDPTVTVLEKSFVVPATPTKIQHLFLSCLDIFWQDIHCNQRVIFYRPIGQDLSTAIETLKRSLTLVLVHFYPWAGRLALGENRRLVIDCNDVGVEFVEASIDLPISVLEKDDFQMKGFFEKLCQRVEYKNESLYASPLLSVQATRFSDGGLAVAVAQSHVVADGQSLWHFMVSWGECARGEALSLEPLHDRARLAVQDASPEKAVLKLLIDEEDDGDEHSTKKSTEATTEKLEATEKPTASTLENGIMTEKPTASTLENGTMTEKLAASIFDEESNGDEYSTKKATEATTEKPTASTSENGTMTEKLAASITESVTVTEKATEQDGAAETGVSSKEADALVQRTFHMSEAAIKKLKTEAADITGRPYSSYEVLCAHFWKRVTAARRQPSSERANFAIAANNRSRLTPPLPSAYFGNAISGVVASSDSGTIVTESLGATAARIHAAIVACTEQHLRGLMHWLELNGNRLFEQFKFEGRVVSVSSSPRFPVYEVDFGWGNPAAVRAVKVPGDGEMVLFGGRPGSRAGDVEICMPLPSRTMKNILHDPHFLASS